MRDELVPPKPKELDKNILKSLLIVVFVIFNLAAAPSGFSRLILGAINPFCIISME
jgi:hypothetical protein